MLCLLSHTDFKIFVYPILSYFGGLQAESKFLIAMLSFEKYGIIVTEIFHCAHELST